MIVYGDPRFTVVAGQFARRIKSALRTAAPNVESLRPILIQAGQLEQAVADLPAGTHPAQSKFLECAMAVTDRVARAFCFMFSHGLGADYPVEIAQGARELALKLLDGLRLPAGLQLEIKVPEGFEFYALYPEQYCESAARWSQAHQAAPARTAWVLGIRSVGTTLSAVVSETLRALNWRVDRRTARPSGHPFSRELQIHNPPLEYAQFGLVVDEGPGLSGSSMAAGALALERCGIGEICLLPGHSRGCGPSALESVRHIWATTPQIFTPLEQLRWDGESLREHLAFEAQRLCNSPVRFEIEDLSGGSWRNRAFDRESNWPPVAAQFERMKLLCRNGDGGQVLWKFAGLGAITSSGNPGDNPVVDRISALAAAGWTAKPLGCSHGFVALPWIDATRLTRADASDPAFLRHLGQYILAASLPLLPRGESEAAFKRLVEMLYWNSRELLGAALAGEILNWAGAVRHMGELPSYGDGHMDPSEWVRQATNASGSAACVSRALKLDCTGHVSDHTIVGPQSILWDIAGAIVEWELSPAATVRVIEPIWEAGHEFPLETLRFYIAAYAAFRAGLFSMASSQTSDPAERRRLQGAIHAYKRRVEWAVGKPQTAGGHTPPGSSQN